MENCDAEIGQQFFMGLASQRATLEAVLRCCVIDEQRMKAIEGLHYVLLYYTWFILIVKLIKHERRYRRGRLYWQECGEQFQNELLL
jgi:hypothetical protein